MKHLDEGTIHAWLDGALDAERAREVEAHTRECATCATAVAEARGLIAASSRILSALDDIPAGVIPAGPAAPPVPATVVAPAPKRVWRAAPWVTGIAAVLLAAIVLRTTRDAPDYAKQAQKMDEVQRTATIALDSMQPRVTEARPAPPTPSAIRSPLVPVREPRPTAPRAEMGIAASEQVAAPSADAAAMPAEKTAEKTEKSAQETERRGVLPPPPTLRDVIAAKAAQRMLPPDSLPASDLAGCYVAERSNRMEQLAAASAMGARKATRASAAPAAAAPAVVSSNAYAPPAGLLVRLDTVHGGVGFIVRSATSDSSLGWWRRVDRDSARVDLLTAGVFTFTPSHRVPCPGVR